MQLKINVFVPSLDNVLFPNFGMIISVIVREDIPLTLFHALSIRYGIWNLENVCAVLFLNANQDSLGMEIHANVKGSIPLILSALSEKYGMHNFQGVLAKVLPAAHSLKLGVSRHATVK